MDATKVMRARCEQAIRTLPLPRPFTLTRFVWQVGEQLGRRIELVPAILGASVPCGMLLGTEQVDFICYAANTSPLHARHIVLHELGHVWLRHQGARVAPLGHTDAPDAVTLVAKLAASTHVDPDVLEALRTTMLPDLPRGVIKRVLGRTLYEAQNEREAELFALLTGPAITRAAAIPAQRAEGSDVPPRVRTVFDAPAASVSRG